MSGRRLKRCKTLTSFSFVEISELEVKGLGASTSSTFPFHFHFRARVDPIKRELKRERRQDYWFPSSAASGKEDVMGGGEKGNQFLREGSTGG